MKNSKMNKKTQNKKNNTMKSLEKRLLSYSIAAGAALVSVETTEAIQYKNLNDVVIQNNPLDPYFLDFNDDGMNDFKFIHSGDDYQNRAGYNIQFSGASVQGVLGNGFVVADVSINKFVINKLDAGEKIDGNGPFNRRGLFGSVINKGAATGSYQLELGNFLGADHSFFGVKFSNGTDQFFGWARVSMATDGSQLTLHDLAYNENPGEHIITGDMGSTQETPVPEPGTLGMLALGAAGVYALRRKKDKTASEQTS